MAVRVGHGVERASHVARFPGTAIAARLVGDRNEWRSAPRAILACVKAFASERVGDVGVHVGGVAAVLFAKQRVRHNKRLAFTVYARRMRA